MLIYYESRIANHPRTQAILSKFPGAQKLEIDHYKNIFDKDGGSKLAPALLLAQSPGNPITQAPANYGYTPHSFFFRASLNCVFDCQYCYLKGAFKSRFPVIFVDYENIADAITAKISEMQTSHPGEEICFYGSNYADTLATEQISWFHTFFVPFFEQFEWVVFESRTKSNQIESLLNINPIPQNFEIAFSLNPEAICLELETGAAPLEKRIAAIQRCLEAWCKVGLRFLPLLPIPNYERIYADFLKDLSQNIDFSRINSVFLGTLLYTKQDYKQIQKLYPDWDVWEYLELQEDGYYRIVSPHREKLIEIFAPYVEKNVVQFG